MSEVGQKHILVIEESQVLREAIRELLVNEGFRVTTTDGGPETGSLLENGAAGFDLIVVSLQLPASQGFDVLAWLRGARPRLGIPILAVTGPTQMSITVERLRGLEAVGVQDARTVWDQLPFRVRAILSPREADQRIAARAPSGLPVNCRVGGAWGQGIIGNISRIGMFVKLEVPPAVGQEVFLQFILPDIPRLFEARARVVWTARRGQGTALPGMGVEFVGLDDTARSQINAFVRAELEKFVRPPAA